MSWCVTENTSLLAFTTVALNGRGSVEVIVKADSFDVTMAYQADGGDYTVF